MKEKKYSLIVKALSKIPRVGNFIRRDYNINRQQKIMDQLTPLFYQALDEMNKKNIDTKISRIIWFFWWQGFNNMTPITQKCYKSILRNSGDRKVILITKENVKSYATIPEYIYKKVNANEISLTHFSDILRFNLLTNYGGLWMDATLYVTKSLNIIPNNVLFTCSGYSDDLRYNIADGRWTGFFIGGPSNLDIFKFVNQFFEDYWKNSDELVDYFLIDYALCFAFNKNLSKFAEVTKRWDDFQPNLFELEDILSKTYNKTIWEKLIQKTSVFKLSNKINVNTTKSDTFYKYI